MEFPKSQISPLVKYHQNQNHYSLHKIVQVSDISL